MECINILKELNARKIQGYKFLIIKKLEDWEKQEILDCGYFIKNTEDGYKISEE